MGKAQTVREVFGRDKTKGDIAFEMEMEGDNLPRLNDGSWDTKVDGSLRYGGYEYVSKGPFKKKEVLDSLNQWADNFGNASVLQSERTSVHVHLNMQEYTPKEVAKGLVAYYLMENSLMKHCGDHRANNLFCLPLSKAPNQINGLKSLSSSEEFQINDNMRYSALNLNALKRFGSVESRAMAGIYEPDHLNQWGQNLLSIFEKSKEFKNPVDVLDHYFRVPYKKYCGTFLSSDMVDKVTSIKDWDLEKERNIPLLGPLLYNMEFTDFKKKNTISVSSTRLRAAEWEHRQPVMHINTTQVALQREENILAVDDIAIRNIFGNDLPDNTIWGNFKIKARVLLSYSRYNVDRGFFFIPNTDISISRISARDMILSLINRQDLVSTMSPHKIQTIYGTMGNIDYMETTRRMKTNCIVHRYDQTSGRREAYSLFYSSQQIRRRMTEMLAYQRGENNETVQL